MRWDASSSEVKSREPFGFRNFFAATYKVERYSRMLWRKDLRGLGADTIPLSFGFLQKVTRRIIKLIRRGRMLLV
jgi:hypothetical protein